MISSLRLEELRQKNICDVDIAELKDISDVVIDKDKPVAERICSFVEQIGNPYLFKVGDTPVKICFATDTPTLQEALEILFTKHI